MRSTRAELELDLKAAERLLKVEPEDPRKERIEDWYCDTLCELIDIDALLHALDGREPEYTSDPPQTVCPEWLEDLKAREILERGKVMREDIKAKIAELKKRLADLEEWEKVCWDEMQLDE